MRKEITSRNDFIADLDDKILKFMVVLATIIVYLSALKDINNGSFRIDWLVIRATYLPYILTVYYLTKRSSRQKVREVTVWASAIYISGYSNYFGAIVGQYINSNYVFGLVQFFFALSIMPVSRFTFYGTLILSHLLSFTTTLLCTGSVAFDRQLSPLMITLNTFSVITYIFSRRNITEKYHSRIQIEELVQKQGQAIVEQHRKLTRANTFEAIAQTTQMLAHDIRKPFSLLKSSVHALTQVTSFDEVVEILPPIKHGVDRALVKVEGMIQDIMELGRDTLLARESYSPKTIVSDSFEEIAQLHESASVSIEYDWQHIHCLSIEPSRVQRVFSNILNNAIEAMEGDGRVWIKTSEENDNIHFVIGNTGTFIEEDNREKIFEAFYTSGKKGGTGLGLIIAKKIVEAHGGNIWVTGNSCEKTTEFHFTLPSHEHKDQVGRKLMGECLSDFGFISSIPLPARIQLTRTQQVQISEVQKLAEKNGGLIRIALVDDEVAYREGLAMLVRESGLADCISLANFSDSKSIFAIDPSELEFIICDLDLGEQGMNGYDVVKNLTADPRFTGSACIHSNKALTQDLLLAAESGAKGFQAKPMSLDYFLKFIIDKFPIPPYEEGRGTSPPCSHGSTTATPLIAFVDDDPLVRHLARRNIDDALVQTFSSPEQFLSELDKTVKVDLLAGLITDNYFGKLSAMSGVEFSKLLRVMGFKGRIVLCSDIGAEDIEFQDAIDGRIDKSEMPKWSEICSLGRISTSKEYKNA
ncbi:MAG: ATP-binding protein [Oligoflexales bacterium]